MRVRFCGAPCSKCGGTERYKCGSCVKCSIARARMWKRMNKPKVAAYSKAYHVKYADRVIAAHRRRKYPEATRPEPERCEMCGEAPTKKRLNLDHCHARKEFRGWLCWDCNVALGKMGDSIGEAMRRLQAYKVVANAD